MPVEQAFLAAVKRGDASAVAELLRERPELSRLTGEHDKTGLHWAAETDQPEVARLLLEAGAELEARTSWGDTPFDWAASMNGRRVAQLLLARGASGLTLITAAGLGDLATVKALARPGVDLSAHRRRGAPARADDHWPAHSAHIKGDVLSDALYAAARNGHEAVVAHLLERGADVDAKGVFGATGLHWAAINGHRGMVELLVAAGARLTARDLRFEATPEDWAREGGHQELAEALAEASRKPR